MRSIRDNGPLPPIASAARGTVHRIAPAAGDVTRAQVLEESRAELRERAEGAERDLAAARADLDRVRAPGDAGPDAPGRARRGRAAQRPGDQAGQ
jgi:hypothetical protein